MARALVRFDIATGRTWTMPLQGEKPRLWTLVEEAPSESPAGEEASPAPE
jgi:hypothetical protein